MGSLPLIIDDSPSSLQHPTRMRSTLRRIKYERGSIGMVVLDYLQQLELRDRNGNNRAQELGKITKALKSMAKEFNCPVVSLAQINRGVEHQSNKRPTMADIRDSGEIEQEADLILLLYRDGYYNAETANTGEMEIIVGKCRNGVTGTCKIQFDPSIGLFNNIG